MADDTPYATNETGLARWEGGGYLLSITREDGESFKVNLREKQVELLQKSIGVVLSDSGGKDE